MTKRGLCILVGAPVPGKIHHAAAMVTGATNSVGHHHGGRPGSSSCTLAQELRGHPARSRPDTDSWEAALRNTLRQAPT